MNFTQDDILLSNMKLEISQLDALVLIMGLNSLPDDPEEFEKLFIDKEDSERDEELDKVMANSAVLSKIVLQRRIEEIVREEEKEKNGLDILRSISPELVKVSVLDFDEYDEVD